MLELNKIYNMDCLEGLKLLDDKSINCCITSPPYYGLRDYGVNGQIGLEETLEEYISNLVEAFKEVKRVLKDDGTLWLNLGDCYAGSGKGAAKDPDNAKKYKQGTNKGMMGAINTLKTKTELPAKNLIGVPWRVAFALQDDGWYLRSDIVWEKPNAMPESVRDRPTKSHEYIFLLSKSPKYYYNYQAIQENRVNGDPDPPRGSKGVLGNVNKGRRTKQDEVGKRTYEEFNQRYKPRTSRNKRSVWTIPTTAFKEAHFATFPTDLIKPCVLAGCPVNGVVLDPFMGSGTTGLVASMYDRNYIGIELNKEYCDIAEKRIEDYKKQVSINDLPTGELDIAR